MKLNIIIILLLTMQALSAQTAYNFTVLEAVTYATEHNLILSKSKLDQDILAAQILEIKGQALPQVTATAGFTDNFSLAEQQLPAEVFGGEPGTTVGVAFGNRFGFTAGTRIEQQLLNFQLSNSLKSAQALVEIQDLALLQSTEDLIINVIQIYIQIQVTMKQVDLLSENLERTNELIRLSEAKFQEGIIKKLDVNQLKVNRSNLRTQIEDVQYQLGEQKRLFKLHLYLPMDAEIKLTERLEDAEAYPLQQQLNVQSNIQYQQMEQQVALSILDQAIEKQSNMPKVSAFLNFNYQGNTNKFSFSPNNYVDQFNGTWGLSASMNIFDGFAKRERISQRQFETKKLQADQQLLQISIEKDYADAVQQMRLSQSQIGSQKVNMELAQENYDGIKVSYSEGVAALTELLDSEFALRQAQSNYLNALLQSKVSELRILKTSGQLSQLIASN